MLSKEEMTDLNKRERAILKFIEKQINEKGYPPSVREIGKAVGLSSTATVHGYLAKLTKKGYITKMEYEDIVNTLKIYGLPIAESDFDIENVVNTTKSDKKMQAGVIKFVVLNEIGKAGIDKEVDVLLMKDSLLELRK